MKNRGMLVSAYLFLVFSLTGCMGGLNDYSGMPVRDTTEATWDSILNQGDVSDVISAELEYINAQGEKENPWLNGDMLRLVTEYDILEWLEKTEEEGDKTDKVVVEKEPGTLYYSNVSEAVDEEVKDEQGLMESYKDYDFYSYEGIQENLLGLEEDIIKPFGFVHDLSKNYANRNMNIMLDDWDETKHYLLGIACGLKVRKEWNSTLQDNVQYGDIIVRTFCAEELAEFLPANIGFEEQARFVFDNVYFHSGVKVSNDLFRLYQYIYNACDFEFIHEVEHKELSEESKEIVENRESKESGVSEDGGDLAVDEVKGFEVVTDFSYWEENNYSFVINNIDKETRQVYIKFVRGTEINDGRIREQVS